MICPECRRNMEDGFLHVNGWKYPIQWFPKEVLTQKTFMPMSKRGTEKAGGIVVPVEQSCMMPHVDAYICKECKKIVINYQS